MSRKWCREHPFGRIRLADTSREGLGVNVAVKAQVHHVLGVLTRAQNVFGGDRAPADPPLFAPVRDLEDDLGRGHF